MIRTTVSSGAPWEAQVGYSRAVRSGPHIAVSGTAPLGPDGRVVGSGDPYRQAQRCLEIIAAALAETGAGLEHVIRTRMFVTDISQWEAVGRAHGEVFGEIRPATSMVQVAALIDAEMLVEIEADAFVP